jgi:hypothetical protein
MAKALRAGERRTSSCARFDETLDRSLVSGDRPGRRRARDPPIRAVVGDGILDGQGAHRAVATNAARASGAAGAEAALA